MVQDDSKEGNGALMSEQEFKAKKNALRERYEKVAMNRTTSGNRFEELVKYLRNGAKPSSPSITNVDITKYGEDIKDYLKIDGHVDGIKTPEELQVIESLTYNDAIALLKGKTEKGDAGVHEKIKELERKTSELVKGDSSSTAGENALDACIKRASSVLEEMKKVEARLAEKEAELKKYEDLFKKLPEKVRTTILGEFGPGYVDKVLGEKTSAIKTLEELVAKLKTGEDRLEKLTKLDEKEFKEFEKMMSKGKVRLANAYLNELGQEVTSQVLGRLRGEFDNLIDSYERRIIKESEKFDVEKLKADAEQKINDTLANAGIESLKEDAKQRIDATLADAKQRIDATLEKVDTEKIKETTKTELGIFYSELRGKLEKDADNLTTATKSDIDAKKQHTLDEINTRELSMVDNVTKNTKDFENFIKEVKEAFSADHVVKTFLEKLKTTKPADFARYLAQTLGGEMPTMLTRLDEDIAEIKKIKADSEKMKTGGGDAKLDEVFKTFETYDRKIDEVGENLEATAKVVIELSRKLGLIKTDDEYREMKNAVAYTERLTSPQ